MNQRLTGLSRAFGATLLLLIVNPGAFAAWPSEQPIRIIVPQPAGGTNDIVARIISVELSKAWNQTVIVENRPGAAGAIGLQAVAQAKPDGYTLGLASDSGALLEVTKPKLTWKFKRDLQGVGMIGDQPMCVAVSARSSLMTFADVLNAAKGQSANLAYGTSGVGSSQHVVGEWLAAVAQIRLLHVPYKGGGQAATDIVSGQIPLAILGLAPMLAQSKSGGVRIVAVTSAKRVAAVPNVPTLTELGYPQIAKTQWAGLVAPTGTPDAIVKQMSETLLMVLSRPEIQQKLNDAGIEPKPLSHQQFNRFLADNADSWARIVPSLQLKLD